MKQKTNRALDRKLVSKEPWEVYYTKKGWFWGREPLTKSQFLIFKGKRRKRETIEKALLDNGCRYVKPVRAKKEHQPYGSMPGTKKP